MITNIKKELFEKSLTLHAIPKEDINRILSIPGSLKTFQDVKFLLDSELTIEEIDKQCILNTCYRLMKINLLF